MKFKFKEALALYKNGQLNRAKEICLEILKEEPSNFDGLRLLSIIFFINKNYLKALELINDAIKADPNQASAYIDQGVILQKIKKPEEALKSYEEALNIKPNSAQVYNNRAYLFFELNKFDDAIESFNKAIELKPDFADAHCNLGNTFLKLNRLEEALLSYDNVIKINPMHIHAYNNRGNVLFKLNKLDEALKNYDSAIKVKFDDIDLHNNRGNVLLELKKPEAALENFDIAIKINSNYANSFYNRGIALFRLNKIDEAIKSYEKSISIDPNQSSFYRNIGEAFKKNNQLQEAINCYETALKINPKSKFLLGQIIHLKHLMCDWKNHKEDLENLEKKILKNEKVTSPFPTLSFFDSALLNKKAAEIFVEEYFSYSNLLPPITRREKNNKIRIGFYSGDFHNHPNLQLIIRTFELFNKSNFELIGFSFGPDKRDQMRKRVLLAFDEFIEVKSKTDLEIVKLSRELKIDIAVDLMSFTQNNRFGIFVERCAPIQVNYLGDPGTMGSNYIDYIIADKIVVPEENKNCYSEKVAYLPNTHQPNDSTRKISNKVYVREELGLPKNGFIFCSFNNTYKITPYIFDTWMKILKRVEDSILWLQQTNPVANKNLQQEAIKRGIDPSRIIFATRMKIEEHLARIKTADLFLDTLPYGASATASDALWAGLPILTLQGKSWASRVAVSLLSTMDLSELITHSNKQYEDLAVKIANNPNFLQEIKDKLIENRLIKPLFNSELITKNIEKIFSIMQERYISDLPVDHIEIK